MEKLVLTEEEQMVRESAADFLTAQAGPAALRAIRDTENPLGYSADTWQQMIELGWPAILIVEEHGGLGFSHAAMGQIMELSGSTLACSPLFTTAVAGASVLSLGGSEAQKSEMLPLVASGELTLALAIDEVSRHNPAHVATRAVKNNDGYVVTGSKTFVVDGNGAKQLIVSARTSGEPGDADGISLFLVPSDADGVDVVRTPMVDSRNAASVKLTDVQVGDDQLIGDAGNGMSILQPALNIANVHLAAELLGMANEAFQRTLQYLKERKQFGIIIGSFQALQHRAAILWTEIELCKSIVLKALRALDESPADASLLASTAKAKTCQTAQLATNEGIQMHGGIGMTDEYDIGFFLKRARVVQMLYGDRRFHLDRCATLSGY
ncbi:MAG: acyl-CoA dehydrogenase family protein [Pseudomonadota bacterium]